MKQVAVLFARADSLYKKLKGVDVYDKERNAYSWPGGCPVIAHPPCRAWGVLSHMAKPEPGEKELALWAVEQVRENGGVLEHPAGSRLFKELPVVHGIPDEWGGFTVEVDQYDFGHVASKPTKLYICGYPMVPLPKMPHRDGEPTKSMTGQVPGTARCTQYEREYTPPALIKWLLTVARRCAK